MDYLNVRSFIKELTYDLDTVQYLLDYGRIKETLPVVDKILDNIDTFRTHHSKNTFLENFWNDRLPAELSFSDIRAFIKQNAHLRSPSIEDNLNKIEYNNFIKNVFNWSEENISKLQHEAKSPLQRNIEKMILYLTGVAVTLILITALGWTYYTKDWGLKGDFYQGEHFKKYMFSGYKKTINFSNPKEMDPRLPLEHFSALWKGDLLIPEDGKYTMTVKFDDGARLIIDGHILIDLWKKGSRTKSKEIFLQKGPHQIFLEYFQYRGPAVLKLFWAIDGSKKEIIPAKYLRH